MLIDITDNNADSGMMSLLRTRAMGDFLTPIIILSAYYKITMIAYLIRKSKVFIIVMFGNLEYWDYSHSNKKTTLNTVCYSGG
jgi:hypothetical protein